MGADPEAVAHAQIARPGFILELQAGTAPQQQHPLALGLVVPEAIGAAGQTGVNPLQSPTGATGQLVDALLARGRAGAAEQIGLIVRSGGAGRRVSPAPTDLKAVASRQVHHLVVLAATAQGIA